MNRCSPTLNLLFLGFVLLAHSKKFILFNSITRDFADISYCTICQKNHSVLGNVIHYIKVRKSTKWDATATVVNHRKHIFCSCGTAIISEYSAPNSAWCSPNGNRLMLPLSRSYLTPPYVGKKKGTKLHIFLSSQ